CKVQAANQMVDAKRFHKTLDLRNTVLRIPYNEAVVAQGVERHGGLILGTDQGMFPASTIFIAVVDHHILFSELPGTFTRFGDDHFTSERVGHVCLTLSGSIQKPAV